MGCERLYIIDCFQLIDDNADIVSFNEMNEPTTGMYEG